MQNPIDKKICKHHGEIGKDLIDKYHRCILCTREQNKNCYNKNWTNWKCRDQEVLKSRGSPEKRRIYRLRHQRKLGEVHYERVRKKQRRYSKELTDGYIKAQLSKKFGISRKLIPDDIVKLEKTLHKLRKALRGRWKNPEYRRKHDKIKRLMKKNENHRHD